MFKIILIYREMRDAGQFYTNRILRQTLSLLFCTIESHLYRRRIKTKKKATVVTVIWEMYPLYNVQYLKGELTIEHQG